MSFEYLTEGVELITTLVATDFEAAWDAVSTLNPMVLAAVLFVSFVLFCFFAGAITNTHSWVDQLWSLAPVAYAQIFAAFGGSNTRVFVMAFLVTAWGFRLTYNFARKGGYNGVEDYRWEVLRSKYITSRVAFEAFNLTYISTVQHLLIFFFTAPIAFVWYEGVKADGVVTWNLLDTIATLGCAGFLALETIADQQQWDFQTAKHNKAPRVAALRQDYERGFLTHGLFAYSRHPNFFAEQSFWASFALFTVAASGQWLNAGLLGAGLLIGNFHFSTNFGEGISVEKYKTYPAYQKSTSRLLPWFPASKAE